MIINTNKKREIIDITDKIEGEIKGVKSGIVGIFVKHTTAAVSTADLDPGGTDQDYLDAFEKIIPKLNYRHPHDPSHMPDHIASTIIGASLMVPIKNGKLVLGQWQRIVLIEFSGPRRREVEVMVLK